MTQTSPTAPFPALAAQVLGRQFSVRFGLDQSIAIGHPSKEHRFDLVSTDGQYVGTCREFGQLGSSQVAALKIGQITAALFFLSFLPDTILRFVALSRDTRIVRGETLGEYYYRIYRHLLRDISMFEIDVETGCVRHLAGGPAVRR